MLVIVLVQRDSILAYHLFSHVIVATCRARTLSLSIYLSPSCTINISVMSTLRSTSLGALYFVNNTLLFNGREVKIIRCSGLKSRILIVNVRAGFVHVLVEVGSEKRRQVL